MIFLPPSYPRLSAISVALTVWLSMLPDAGVGVVTAGHADLLAQGVEDLLPGAVGLPLGEVVVDGALGRQVVREHVPLAARAVEVEDGVEHLPHVDLAGPSHVDGRGSEAR